MGSKPMNSESSMKTIFSFLASYFVRDSTWTAPALQLQLSVFNETLDVPQCNVKAYVCDVNLLV